MSEKLLREWVMHLLCESAYVHKVLKKLPQHTDTPVSSLSFSKKGLGDFSTEGKILGKLAEHSVADALTGHTRTIESGPWSPIVSQVLQDDSLWQPQYQEDGTMAAARQLVYALYLNMKKAVESNPATREFDLGTPEGSAPFEISGDTGTVDVPTDKADIHVKYNESASGSRLVGLQLPRVSISDFMPEINQDTGEEENISSIQLTQGQISSLHYRLAMKQLYDSEATKEVLSWSHPPGGSPDDDEAQPGKYINPENGHLERKGIIRTTPAIAALMSKMAGSNPQTLTKARIKSVLDELKVIRKKSTDVVGSTVQGDVFVEEASKARQLYSDLSSADQSALVSFAKLIEKSEDGFRKSKSAFQNWMKDDGVQKKFIELLKNTEKSKEDANAMVSLIPGIGGQGAKERKQLYSQLMASQTESFQTTALKDAIDILLGAVSDTISAIQTPEGIVFRDRPNLSESMDAERTVAVARFFWSGGDPTVNLDFEIFNLKTLKDVRENAEIKFGGKGGDSSFLEGQIVWQPPEGSEAELFVLRIRTDGDKKTVQLETGADYENVLANNFVSEVQYKSSGSGEFDLSAFVARPDIQGPEGDDSFVLIGNTGDTRRRAPGEIWQDDTRSGKWLAKNKSGEPAEFSSEDEAKSWARSDKSEVRRYIRDVLSLLRS